MRIVFWSIVTAALLGAIVTLVLLSVLLAPILLLIKIFGG